MSDGPPIPNPLDTPRPAELAITGDHAPRLGGRRDFTIADLALLGSAELAQMARDGELGPAKLWVAFKGAKKYAEAIARGDFATEGKVLRRLATCRDCPHRTTREVVLPTITVDAWHCGPAFEEHGKPGELSATCGCLQGISIRGEQLDRPAGAALVESHPCWQGRYR